MFSFEINTINLLSKLLKNKHFYTQMSQRGAVYLLLDIIEVARGCTRSGWLNLLIDFLKSNDSAAFTFLFTWSGTSHTGVVSLLAELFINEPNDVRLQVAIIWRKFKGHLNIADWVAQKYNFTGELIPRQYRQIGVAIDFHLNSLYSERFTGTEKSYGFAVVPVGRTVNDLKYEKRLKEDLKEDKMLHEFYNLIRQSNRSQ